MWEQLAKLEMPDCANVVFFVHAVVKLMYTLKIQIYNKREHIHHVEAHEIMTKLRSMTKEFNDSKRDKVMELIHQADQDL
eukprot:1428678-Karenia_brevis.AAC.1